LDIVLRPSRLRNGPLDYYKIVFHQAQMAAPSCGHRKN
jgi:hypothetical protein